MTPGGAKLVASCPCTNMDSFASAAAVAAGELLRRIELEQRRYRHRAEMACAQSADDRRGRRAAPRVQIVEQDDRTGPHVGEHRARDRAGSRAAGGVAGV